ncbi:helix-turn-helix domain-containing protein [Nocardia goodfellowii]|uniref:AraC-like DNA-binding protein n=1 Tax=Nocardia goodfellowii TaxID=882446 RepID=A0ABS4QD26_9NOCA|nr:helix-turn-helix domain-containing protein [Nocardia goodfellowii]MBP2189552.1 AraC-like DNA-binding protein [Nocardia goodfellowii]
MDPTTDTPPRGLLDPRAGDGLYRESLIPACPALADIVAHHWAVHWDLRERDPYVVEVLSHPAVILVVENGRCRVHGVLRGKFSQRLSGCGDIFGTTFRPAGFHPLVRRSVAALTDRVVPGTEIFGAAADRYAATIAATPDTAARKELSEEFVRQHISEPARTVALVNEIVDEVSADRTILRVDDVTARFGMGKRTLQKLFRDLVGVSPKWVIQRYRLHEAAQRLDSADADLATVAAELGYADQAHFARDFKSATGRPPATYRG